MELLIYSIPMPNGETIGVLIKALAPTVAEKILGVVKDYRKIKERDIILLVLAINAEQNAKTEIILGGLTKEISKLSHDLQNLNDCVNRVDENVDTLLNRSERQMR